MIKLIFKLGEFVDKKSTLMILSAKLHDLEVESE